MTVIVQWAQSFPGVLVTQKRHLAYEDEVEKVKRRRNDGNIFHDGRRDLANSVDA